MPVDLEAAEKLGALAAEAQRLYSETPVKAVKSTKWFGSMVFGLAMGVAFVLAVAVLVVFRRAVGEQVETSEEMISALDAPEE
jgi:hypothetical protein